MNQEGQNRDFLHTDFNVPHLSGKELHYISEAVLNRHLSGNGPFHGRCADILEKQIGSAKALLTHSCTGALEMSAILSNIQAGDEVIMPSFTFVSTANAFVCRGAIPVFVDIREDTLNIDENKIEEAITEKTKAIVVVHYAGVACEMDPIMNLAKKHNLVVIEDAAQAIMCKYKNKALGSFGRFACLSFHETKNLISGEGGALLINQAEDIEASMVIWEKGTNRKAFLEGRTDKYTWVDIGSSFLPSELIAAFLFAQFENAEDITQTRLKHWNDYQSLLKPLVDKEFIKTPCIPSHCQHNAHMFYILLKDEVERKKLIDHLYQKEIFSVSHYVPLHSSPAGEKYGRYNGPLKVTDSTAACILRLPMFYALSDDQKESVAQTIHSFFNP